MSPKELAVFLYEMSWRKEGASPAKCAEAAKAIGDLLAQNDRQLVALESIRVLCVENRGSELAYRIQRLAEKGYQ